MSVQKLSSPNEDPIFDKRLFGIQNENLSHLIAYNKINDAENNWKKVVEKRIAEKTKIKKVSNKRSS